ncbi:50S ribosomal protein L22 [Mesomycoplasma lagogenitalium]|uniref:Large ribosomal subunit protein uL22 n=1 Tax=Mesomycoplasma lagogenitalium TaxID=171286 RepID=A0ABY8LVM4_9BACT|nr:50S ribosomal protein L22 [Mesomycoplasma lagogenitalium]WGI36583.1 50S ribosomal protein L22 [Mesomycoplasma lagogenitalium]
MESVAKVKMQRVSPRKARLVADLFRYKNTEEALSILHNTNKKSSKLFIKLLNSAIAGAVNNKGMDGNSLYVSDVQVNEGPTYKRFQPRSKGTAYSIFKRTSHLSITVKERK